MVASEVDAAAARAARREKALYKELALALPRGRGFRVHSDGNITVYAAQSAQRLSAQQGSCCGAATQRLRGQEAAWRRAQLGAAPHCQSRGATGGPAAPIPEQAGRAAEAAENSCLSLKRRRRFDARAA